MRIPWDSHSPWESHSNGRLYRRPLHNDACNDAVTVWCSRPNAAERHAEKRQTETSFTGHVKDKSTMESMDIFQLPF